MFKRKPLAIDIYDLAEEYSYVFRELFTRLENEKDEKLIDYILDRVNFLKASIRPHHAKYNRGEIFINFLLDYPNPSEKVLRFFKILSYDLSDYKGYKEDIDYKKMIEDIISY